MNRWRDRRLSAVCWVVLGLPLPMIAAAPLTLREQAITAEQLGRWDQALESYLKLAHQDGTTPELREQIRRTLRQAASYRRHRDPQFYKFVLGLSQESAERLYLDVLEKLAQYYHDAERATPTQLIQFGFDALEESLHDPRFCPTPSTLTQQKLQSLFHHMRQSGTVVSLEQGMQKARRFGREVAELLGLSPATVLVEMLAGACTRLDESTQFREPSPPDPLQEFRSYGLSLIWQQEHLIVESVVAGSYADLILALQTGDRIVRINDQPVDTLPNVLTALLRLKSTVGSSYELRVTSPDQLSTISVRLPVPVPTVFAASMVPYREGIGYVRLSSFREQTPRELDEAIESLRSQGLRSLVLDLRGNPGGLLTAAVMVAQRFLAHGIIVSTQGQVPEFASKTFSAGGMGPVWDFPVVALIDSRTMSSAELLAAALKDQGRATIIGMPTFGKGSIQCPIRVANGTLMVTVATMQSPSGRSLRQGVEPHQREVDPVRQLEQAIARAAEVLAQPVR